MEYYSNTPSKLNMKLNIYTSNHSLLHDYKIKKFYNNMQSLIPLIENQFSYLKCKTNKLAHYSIYNYYYQPVGSFMTNNKKTHFEKCKSCNYYKNQIEKQKSEIKELTNLLNKKQSNIVNNICIQNVQNVSKNKYIDNKYKTSSNELKLAPNKNNSRYGNNNKIINNIDENDDNNFNEDVGCMPISLEDMQKITKKKSFKI